MLAVFKIPCIVRVNPIGAWGDLKNPIKPRSVTIKLVKIAEV